MRRVLNVFIASPSDLVDERRRAFDVVTEVNETLKIIDWSIDLLGWEDTLPGIGRPQARINRDVERCDLFIGLLWRRWGSPPAVDSTFTSGFEEEFSIARHRRERTPSPEIWMFFKTVEMAQISDAGTQLQRVIDFRESLVASKEILFKEFDTTDAWGRMLQRYLQQHVLSIPATQRGAPEGPSEQTPQPTKNISAEANAPGARAAGRQLAALADALRPAFDTGDVREIVTAIGDPREATFLAVRSMLFSAAFATASGCSDASLPVHELNTLYLYRDRLQATDDELFVLLRTVVADDSDVKPGWYWFRNRELPVITDALVVIALLDSDTATRARSFEILRRARLSIFTGARDPAVARALGEIPTDLRGAAWAYLVDVVTPENLKVLGESANGTWLESRVEWLHAWTEAGRSLDGFLPKMPDPQLIPDPMTRSILASIPQLANVTLDALKSMPLPDLSEAAATELKARSAPVSERGRAPDAEFLSLMDSMLGDGFLGPTSEPRPTGKERYERLSHENSGSLRNSLYWYNLDGPFSYRLLVERGEIAREIVRKDLSDEFQRIRDDSNRRMEEALGAEFAAKQRQEFEEFREFITKRYTVEALVALAREPTTEDATVARQFLNYYGARAAALRIVASKGTAADVEGLIEIARSSFGDRRKLALDGVLRLTDDKLGTAKRLMVFEDRNMRCVALSLISGLGDEDALPALGDLLADEDENIRIGAVGQLIKRVNLRRLADVLREYIGRRRYFYNVVVWLDRVLYAPPLIVNYFVSELGNKVKALDH